MEDTTILAQAIVRHEIGGEETQAVDARTLHAFLEVGKDFSNWIKDRVKQYGLVEEIDFVKLEGVFAETGGNSGGRPSKEYALTVEAAKELCMVERNARGKQARLYFIEMERQARAVTKALAVPTDYPSALRLSADLAERLMQQEAVIQELAPKAAFHDMLADAEGCLNLGQAAHAIGTDRKSLVSWMLSEGICRRNEGRRVRPNELHVKAGRFRVVKATRIDEKGAAETFDRVMVVITAMDWLKARWEARIFL